MSEIYHETIVVGNASGNEPVKIPVPGQIKLCIAARPNGTLANNGEAGTVFIEAPNPFYFDASQQSLDELAALINCKKQPFLQYLSFHDVEFATPQVLASVLGAALNTEPKLNIDQYGSADRSFKLLFHNCSFTPEHISVLTALLNNKDLTPQIEFLDLINCNLSKESIIELAKHGHHCLGMSISIPEQELLPPALAEGGGVMLSFAPGIHLSNADLTSVFADWDPNNACRLSISGTTSDVELGNLEGVSQLSVLPKEFHLNSTNAGVTMRLHIQKERLTAENEELQLQNEDLHRQLSGGLSRGKPVSDGELPWTKRLVDEQRAERHWGGPTQVQ